MCFLRPMYMEEKYNSSAQFDLCALFEKKGINHTNLQDQIYSHQFEWDLTSFNLITLIKFIMHH